VTFAGTGRPANGCRRIARRGGRRGCFRPAGDRYRIGVAATQRRTLDPIRARLIGLSAQNARSQQCPVLEGQYFYSADESASSWTPTSPNISTSARGYRLAILNGTRVDFPVVGVVASPEYLMPSPSKTGNHPLGPLLRRVFPALEVLQEKLGATGDGERYRDPIGEAPMNRPR